ncbi:MAG: hypothetical protein KAG64_00415 [Bacteroidales bacterium]|nr:hypothetical protein [Bacteroidales bacterium]
MSELGKLVDLIEVRSRKLVNRKQGLEDENSKLKSQLAIMQIEIENQHKVINELKDKYQVLRIAKTIESEGESKESIKELNFYIKEIDRCIALMNS